MDTLRSAGFRNSDVSLLFGALNDDSGAGDLGWLGGIGAVSIPGSGPLIAAGPIMGLLGAVGMIHAPAGLAGILMTSYGVPEYEARRFERRMRANGVLLAVICENDGQERRARSILDHHDAEDVSRGTSCFAARCATGSSEGC
jgi:hypothetical protein